MVNKFIFRITEAINTSSSKTYLYPLLFYCTTAFFLKILWNLIIKTKKISTFDLAWIFYEGIFIIFFIIIILLFMKITQHIIKNTIGKLNNAVIILLIISFFFYTFNINYHTLHIGIFIGIVFECIFTSISYIFNKEKKSEFFIFNRFLLFTLSFILVNNLIWWNRNFFTYFKSNTIIKIELIIFMSILSFYLLIIKNKMTNYLITNKFINNFFSFFMIAFLLLLSFRPKYDLHHWGAFLGPIDAVRNGGVLLWDTPEQYGLLNTYIPSKFLAFLDPINSFYLFNSFIIFLYSLTIFLIIKNSFKGIIGLLISFLITYSTVFTLCGWMDSTNGSTGPTAFPSSSGIRFLPVLYLIYFIIKYKNILSINIFLFYLTLIWTIGSFWSSESLVYCSLVFFTTIFFVSNQSNIFPISEENYKLNFKNIALSSKNILYSILFFLCVLIAVYIIFYLNTSKLMDFQSFFDVALSVKADTSLLSYPINFEKSIIAVGFIFCIIIQTVFSTIINNESKNFLKIMPTFIMIYAVESYFLARSHENNHLNLLPLTTIGVIFLIEIWQSNNDKYKWIPITIMPVISIICINAINYSNKKMFSHIKHIDSLFSVSENFRKEQYKAYGSIFDIHIPTDAAVGIITYYNGYISPTLYLKASSKTNFQLFFPGPFYIAHLLKPDRLQLHLRRFIPKIKAKNGLIIVEKELVEYWSTISILETIKETFILYKEVRNKDFNFYYFIKKDETDKTLIN